MNVHQGRAPFDKLAEGLDVSVVDKYILLNHKLWGRDTLRQSFPGSPHVDTEVIFIRGPNAFTAEEYQGNTHAIWYSGSSALNRAVDDLFDEVALHIKIKELGYVMLVSLEPEGKISEHTDEGVYAEYYQRFHIPIFSKPGNIFKCSDEYVSMKEGELWTFNHRLPHSVVNSSTEERIHLIFDAIIEK